MTKFYTFTSTENTDGQPTVAADHAGRVYFYLANTKLWHHEASLEIQLDSNLHEWKTTEVSAGEVQELIRGLSKMDGRGYSGRYLRDLKAQPPEDKRTSAELGLRTLRNDRPVAGGGIRPLLEALSIDKPRMIARYETDRKAVAQNLAYEINNGLKKALEGLDLLAATQETDGDVVVTLERKKPAARRPATSKQSLPV